MKSKINNLEIEHKLLRRQLKLTLGISRAPPEQQTRMKKLLESLAKKTGVEGVEEIKLRLSELKAEQERAVKKKKKIPKSVSLKAWYIRPLLSHLDHPTRLRQLDHYKIGVSNLPRKIKLHLPSQWEISSEDFANYHRFFYFKSMGKGTLASESLEGLFFKYIEISDNLPFSVPGVSDIPALHYNIERLWKRLESEGKPVTIVTGLCPFSIITDEIHIFYTNGIVERPSLGFGPLPTINTHIDRIGFPPRPIFGDYLELVRAVRLANALVDKFGVNSVELKIWLPLFEYELALKTETFFNYFKESLLDPLLIKIGLQLIGDRYKKLVEAVLHEQGKRLRYNFEITTEDALDNQMGDLEKLFNKSFIEIIKREIPFVYGMYKGTVLRKTLFGMLAYKHFQPMLANPNMNVLHIENSYEIWPSALAARWVSEKLKTKPQDFSFLLFPSTPSPSLRFMRTLNSPYEQKLYLARSHSQFEGELEKLGDKYCELISSLLPELSARSKKTEARKNALITKLIQLNYIFS